MSQIKSKIERILVAAFWYVSALTEYKNHWLVWFSSILDRVNGDYSYSILCLCTLSLDIMKYIFFGQTFGVVSFVDYLF